MEADAVRVTVHIGSRCVNGKKMKNIAHAHAYATDSHRGVICMRRDAYDPNIIVRIFAHELAHIRTGEAHTPEWAEYLSRYESIEPDGTGVKSDPTYLSVRALYRGEEVSDDPLPLLPGALSAE